MYGKCQRCEALGSLELVGTLDGNTGTPVVLRLCSQCSKLYLHLNRADRRRITRAKPPKLKRKPDNYTLLKIRERARAPKQSSILLPKVEPRAPEPPKSPIVLPPEKGGLILP